MNNHHIEMKLISEQDILKSGCVNFDSIISTVEDVFIDYNNGNVMLPDKISQVFDQTTQNRINCMPSTLFTHDVCGVKWVSVFPENPHKFCVPNVSGVIVLSELEKGYPFAIYGWNINNNIENCLYGSYWCKISSQKRQ